jgi:hypothetical protein
MKIQTVVIGGAHLTKLTLTLLAVWLTLDWRVRRMRRAFEKQLVMQGMSEDDAKRLSACFEELKNNITSMLKQGIAKGFQSK